MAYSDNMKRKFNKGANELFRQENFVEHGWEIDFPDEDDSKMLMGVLSTGEGYITIISNMFFSRSLGRIQEPAAITTAVSAASITELIDDLTHMRDEMVMKPVAEV